MADLYLARLVRICPPRAGATYGSGAARAVSVSNASAATRLDNDLFQVPLQNGANVGTVVPGTVGRALVEFTADGNDCYVNFGGSGVAANSAATSGNTVAALIPAGQSRNYEIDPMVDQYVAAVTKSGSSNTATLRYRIVSFPTNSGNPG